MERSNLIEDSTPSPLPIYPPPLLREAFVNDATDVDACLVEVKKYFEYHRADWKRSQKAVIHYLQSLDVKKLMGICDDFKGSFDVADVFGKFHPPAPTNSPNTHQHVHYAQVFTFKMKTLENFLVELSKCSNPIQKTFALNHLEIIRDLPARKD